MANKRDLEIAELKGVGKILDILWENSYYSMGKEASKRLEAELIYYFGEEWTTDMYKIIEEKGNIHKIEPVKTLEELSLN